ncbi:MAG: HlyD family efflux transporter periplasmic adaptor subunit [Cyanothece sp. SIO1E1]|nr:HlyD family efflux transporter periplasmic adaptor subunit [Cyanothece sp. SIO1E1]
MATNGSGYASDFDQPVILQQSPRWSQAIVWTLIGVTGFALTWACFAKIEEAIPAQGKLEPKAAVKEVQAPVGGVVKEVHVQEGEPVDEGELLVSFDPTAAQAQKESFEKIRAALVMENQFYQIQMHRTDGNIILPDADVKVPPQLVSLTQNRVALAAENKFYRALLSGGGEINSLSPAEQARMQAIQSEVSSRATAAALEVEQLTRQLTQAEVQLAQAEDSFALNSQILDSIETLLSEGAVGELQYLQQKQEKRNSQADMERFAEERERLKLAISQAKEQLQNTLALSRTDVLNNMADNEKRIAEIDSQLTKVIVENEKQIQEIDSQLSQTQLTLTYQELRSPVNGTVFDLQAGGPGFVSNTSEPILRIVPKDGLVARVFITNQDIGFVEEKMEVDVRVDSFPYSEFGDIKGKLIRIGSDALPPNEVYPFYRFPAEVRLEGQAINVNGKDVPLQSGMSVTTNIKVRKRSVISLFTDLFAQKVESLKSTR